MAYKCNKITKSAAKILHFAHICKDWTKKNRILLRFFLCLAFSYQYSVVSVQSSVFSNQFLDSAMTPFISGEQIFENSVFAKAYDRAAMDSFKESREVFGTLFSDPKKYGALKKALAAIMYREFRKNG